MMHYPSEMPYRCENCGYRTSSHKNVIDHYYNIHEKGEGLQCPYCLKVRIKELYNANVIFTYIWIKQMLLLLKGNTICK